MDARSHILFGTTILSKCNLGPAYALWSTTPDTDLWSLQHRYKRHRFSVLPKIYSESITLNPSLPKSDKIAIALMILSHFYLDIFNGYIFCWGLRCPSIHIPPHVTSEYIDDLNYNLLHNKPDEAIETFFAKSESLFNTLPTMSTDEAFTFLLGDLTRYTRVLPTPHRAIQNLQSFANATIAYSPKAYTLSFTSKYYSFLNAFFQKW